MADHIVTLNAGSSSIKFALFEAAGEWPDMLASGQVEGLGLAPEFSVRCAGQPKMRRDFTAGSTPRDHADALALVIAWLAETFADVRVAAVGHRVVHGGTRFSAPILLDADTVAVLAGFAPLAPLHQPHNLAGIAAAAKAFPGVPQVGCFDTAFHRTAAFVEETYALPPKFFQEGVRRYGFHGLSYEYVTRRLAARASDAGGRAVIAHLGNGASMCAVRDGRSVSCTMGFSPLDGLAMGTRCGQIDPGVLLHLIDQRGMSVAEVSDLLYKRSGLLGMSGVSSDMRALEGSDDPAAARAIAYFVARIKRELGGLAAVLGGLDTLVFTGGIGENAWRIREAVLGDMAWAGIEVDRDANRRGDETISTATSRVMVRVIATDEEAMIAHHTARTAAASALSRTPED